MEKSKLYRLLSRLVIITIILAVSGFAPGKANAASLTSMADYLTRLKAATAANHEIFFVTPTGIAASQSIILTFAGFTTSVNSIVTADVDFATGSTGTCSSATYTEQPVVASGATASQWNVTEASMAITIQSGGASATLGAGLCGRIRIGTNAVSVSGTGPGVNQITSGAAATDHTITFSGAGGFADSGTLDVDIIADDQVAITATVSPTITFTIDDNAIGFGTLSTATGRWATANAAGTNASATTPTAANSFTVATNAASGWVLTYAGTTLTFGGFTINAATITGDSDGAPGTEQFALTNSVSGSGPGTPSAASGYARSASSDLKFNSGDTISSSTGAATLDTIVISYLANISGSTEAGAYATTLTYVMTGRF